MGRRAGPPTTILRGGVWYARFTVDGKQRTVTTGERDPGRGKSAAAKIHATAVLDAGSVPVKPAATGPRSTLDLDTIGIRYFAWAERQGLAKRHVEEQQRTIENHFLPWGNLRNVTAARISKWQAERSRKVGTVTLYKNLVSLSRFLKWCKREGLIAAVPEFERPRQSTDYEVPNLSDDDVQRFLAALPDRAAHPRRFPIREWATWVWSMAFRKSEASAILWSDVDLPGGTVTVRANVDKNRKRWVLPLTEEARRILAVEARRPHGASDPIFCIKRPQISFEQATEALGLPGVTPHHLRHFRISEWANSTRRLAAVQFMARHLSIATTAKYVRSRTEAAAEMLAEVAAAKHISTDRPGNSSTVAIVGGSDA